MSVPRSSDLSQEEHKIKLRRFIIEGIVLALLIGTIAILAKVASPLQAAGKPSIDLEQCSNDVPTCDTGNGNQWITGNLGTSNSTFVEGDAVPYRAVLSNLIIGHTYMVVLEWDTTKSGLHALDYVTSFDYSEVAADPCAGISCSATVSTLTIPNDPQVASGMVTQASGQVFTAYGATFPANGTVVNNTGGNLCGSNSCTIASNPSTYGISGSYASDSATTISVYLTATDTSAVLSWGGHIASRVDWGTNQSASSISGSPYHMRAVNFQCTSDSNCSVGNMDRSLSSAAVVLPASITIVKESSMEDGTEFAFSASPLPLAPFTLIDDGSSANTVTFAGITNFGSYTVTENAATGWDFNRVSCSIENQTTGSATADGASVNIVIAEGEDVTCTFYNDPTPVAALALAKTSNVATFAELGAEVTYSYELTNSGETILGPAQFYISDDKINSGTPFECGATDTTLAIGDFVTCSAEYVITQEDVDAGAVTNIAFGIGAGVSTSTKTVTVSYVPVQTTTTTEVPVTTTTEVPVTTTTTPPVTTTTPVVTTTTPVVTTTTVAVLVQSIVTEVPVNEEVASALVAELLPNTGVNIGIASLISGVLLLIGLAATTTSYGRRSRDSETREQK